MKARRPEIIAAVVVLLVSFGLCSVSYSISNNISYDSQQADIRTQEQIVNLLINIASGLLGSVILFVVYQLLFGFRGDTTDSSDQSVDASKGQRDSSRSPDLPVTNDAQWSGPLMEALQLLIEDGTLNDPRSLEPFSSVKFANGQSLLKGNDIRRLQTEIRRRK